MSRWTPGLLSQFRQRARCNPKWLGAIVGLSVSIALLAMQVLFFGGLEAKAAVGALLLGIVLGCFMYYLEAGTRSHRNR